MAKSKKRQKILADKRTRKANMMKASGRSNYAQKAKFLAKTGKMGFEVPEPKPWKSKV